MMALSHTWKRNGPMAATCVPLLAVERTNPHPTETDDIFCKYIWVQCRIFWREEWREMMVPDMVWNTAGRRGGGGRVVQGVWSFALAYYEKNWSVKHATLARFISALNGQSSELKRKLRLVWFNVASSMFVYHFMILSWICVTRKTDAQD
jgi:hypothetical protein